MDVEERDSKVKKKPEENKTLVPTFQTIFREKNKKKREQQKEKFLRLMEKISITLPFIDTVERSHVFNTFMKIFLPTKRENEVMMRIEICKSVL